MLRRVPLDILRVVVISLIPSGETVNKLRGKKQSREILLLVPRISRGHFFPAVFFCVTYDGLTDRGSTGRLAFRRLIDITTQLNKLKTTCPKCKTFLSMSYYFKVSKY